MWLSSIRHQYYLLLMLLLLAEKSDGVMLVVRNEVASPKDLIEAKKRLTQVGIPLLGSIVIDA